MNQEQPVEIVEKVTYFRVKEYEHIFRVVIHGGMDHLVGYVFEDETNNFDATIHSSPRLAQIALEEYCAIYLDTPPKANN